MRTRVLAWVLFVFWPCKEPVYAGTSTADLALAVAQVAAHEGALRNLRDVDLIWQCVEARGDTDAKRLRWLQKHSPRALGLKPPKLGDVNAWSSELGRNATLPADVASGDPKRQSYWRFRVMPRWAEVLARAQHLASGGRYEKPCPSTPTTWGGPMDHEVAAEMGLYPLGCQGTLNDGFAPRGQS
jgi:hypothetical protein